MYALNAIATAKTIIRKSKWATAVRNEKKILYEDNYELISNPKYFVFIYYLHGTCGRQHANSKLDLESSVYFWQSVWKY